MHVTYVLLHFPYLTETFVAQEMRTLRERGAEVSIVSLLAPGDGPIQRDSQDLMPFCWYAPSLVSPKLWRAQLYYFFSRFSLYVHLLWQLLRQPYPAQPLHLLTKRVVIFLKAVATAYQLREHRIDLLHTHFAWLSGAATWVCAKFLDVPYTITTHAYDIYAKDDLLDLATVNAARVFTISDYNRENILARGHCAAAAVDVVHCGVDISRYQYVKDHNKVFTADRPLHIVSVGSLNEKKGHEYLIRACGILRNRGIDFRCDIIGGGSREMALLRLIAELSVGDCVTIRGAMPHELILEAYAEADLFVLACVVASNGDRDGIPVAIMEAAMAELGIISTKVSGIPELILDEETGLLVPARDAEALASAIERMERDVALRKQLGTNARQRVLEAFNADRIADQLVEAMNQIVELQSGRTSGHTGVGIVDEAWVPRS